MQLAEGYTAAPFEMKASDAKSRRFTGLASAWSLDLGGDVIVKGAFARTLDHWRQSAGRRIIPLCDQHSYKSIRNVLGRLESATETNEGLLATFQVVPGQDGDELMHRLRDGGYVNGLSIGYEVVKSEPSTVAGQSVRLLKEVRLREVSVVLWGMNPDALIVHGSVKRARVESPVDAWRSYLDPAADRYADTAGLSAKLNRLLVSQRQPEIQNRIQKLLERR